MIENFQEKNRKQIGRKEREEKKNNALLAS